MSKVIGSIASALLVMSLFQITLSSVPAALGTPGSSRKEIWKVVWLNNTQSWGLGVDVTVNVSSRKGVNIACSNSTTIYFSNLAYWQGLGSGGYATYWDWLNGTKTLPHHWNESTGGTGWSVSNGSLTPVSYSDIQFWGEMYFDSGGGANYQTFMSNTFMADWNLSDPTNKPDIIYQKYWQGNQINIVNATFVPANANTTLVFDIVITEPGSFTFNVTTTAGVDVSVLDSEGLGWTVGGAATVLVPSERPTIQAGINAANPDDTIVVHTGTYREEVQINKSVSIIGDGADVTFINGSTVSLSSAGLVKITANSGNVRFSGFTVANASAVGGVRFGIFSQSNAAGPTYTISNNKIYGTNNPLEADDYGFYASSGKEKIVFTHNLVTQTGANNIVLELHTGPTEISYNTLDAGAYGADTIFCMTYNGIDVTTLQNVSYNTFNMSTGEAFDYAHRATGVSFATPGGYPSPPWNTLTSARFTNVVISGNTINNLQSNRRGIGFWNGNSSANNIVSPLIANNTVNGVAGSADSYGIDFLGLTTGAIVSGNTVNGTAVGIYLRSGDAPGTTIRYNNIVNNTVGIDWTLGTTAVDAGYNWWGSANGPNYTSSQYPNSTGDKISGNVLVEPWLVKPYAPPALPAPICVAQLNPQSKNLTAPALGTVFTTNLVISNVTLMYGFQFTLKWDPTLLNLTNPTTAKKVPTGWGTLLSNYNYSLSGGNYSLWESPYGTSQPFNGTVTVASFTFNSTYDPIYPQNSTCNLTLTDFWIGDSSQITQPIPHLVYNGSYYINSAKPQLLFTANYTATKLPTDFYANINVTNIINLQSFCFEFDFDPTLLSIQGVSLPYFSGNPEIHISPIGMSDRVLVNVTGISPVINGTVLLSTIKFRVEKGFVWNTSTSTINSTLDFTLHMFNTTGGVSIDHEAINGNYTYRAVQGDVNTDGVVDLVDLGTVAQAFGTNVGDPGWNPNYDLNGDSTVNILDVILVARNYGGR